MTLPLKTPYEQPQLLEKIYHRLSSIGISPENLTRKDLAFVDEFHLQGALISKDLAQIAKLSSGLNVLDIGCGIGGACRMMVEEYGCKVLGIDYTAEYIQVAKALTEKVGLGTKAEFIHASALNLPVSDESFDRVWTQHAQMNIAEKPQLFEEVDRVLKRGGTFLYYDIFGVQCKDIYFPVPWAVEASQSYLMEHKDWPGYTSTFAWESVYHRDYTSESLIFLERAVQGMKKGKGPKVGLDILMGDSALLRFENLLKCLKEKRVEVHAGLFLGKSNTDKLFNRMNISCVIRVV